MLKKQLSGVRVVIKRLFHSLAFLFDILYAKIFKKYTRKSHEHLLNCFYLLGGFIHLKAAVALGKPKIDFPNVGLLSKFTHQELEIASDHLKREGYVVLKNVLSGDLCEQILKASQDIPGSTRIMDGGVGKNLVMKFDRTNPQSVRFDYDGKDLVANPTLQELIFDESILRFAQDYLGAAPILDLVAMWWHTTFNATPDKEAAQWFHFDMDRLKWIKFFFYITDVDSNSGPHTFIARSHKNLGIPYKLRSKGYSRLSDDEVASAYDAKNYIEFTGKRGTLIIEDTRGLHKGKHCISGDRLLFQLEFTTSSFGTPLPELKIGHAFNPNSTAGIMVNKYPYVYSAIIN